jgi:hypothetical protein
MAWRAAQSLLVLHQQLQAGAPRAKPPATSEDEWGLLGDSAHDPSSDHTPHDFPGWGNDIVTAADFPNRPDLGLDAHQVLDDIRRAQDERAKYGISNGQIFSNHEVTEGGRTYPAWTWRPYNPKNGDRHFTHGHLSVVGDSRADGTQPWPTIGEEEYEDDMGASFGPIPLGLDITSLSLPPVGGGAADPRDAWLNIGNDTFGPAYALRIYWSDGAGNWTPLGAGQFAIRSGVTLSIQLPPGTRILSFTRKAIDQGGSIVDPSDDVKPYSGPLTCCIERGPVKH